MLINKINHNGNEYEFVCEWKNTRSGFKHECNLFVNGRLEASATCIYYNRTWESYEYQSVMLRAVSNILDEHTEYLKDCFKRDNGYEKMTAKRKAQFEEVLTTDEIVNELLAVKEKLHKRY